MSDNHEAKITPTRQHKKPQHECFLSVKELLGSRDREEKSFRMSE